MNPNRKIIEPNSVVEQLLYSTVRICGDTGTGTGFFFRCPINESLYVELILTNKHVVNENKKLEFYFHEAVNNDGKNQPTNRSFSIQIENYSKIWIPHPDTNVDLGALSFVQIRDHAKQKMEKDIFSILFDKNLIRDDDVLEREADVAEEILMIGYPVGLWDELNNFPIIRKGIAATHPALDFQDKSIGVVDIACFPGSSGSPIISYVSGAYYDKPSKSFKIGQKVILLGLLFGGPVHTSEEKIEIKEIPVQQVPITKSHQWIHLGYYVKAKEILVLCEYIRNKLKE